jgi:classical protein kinase C
MRPAQDVDTKLADIRERIAKERKILDAFQNMKMATSNSDVHKSCDAKIKETTKTIGYFEDSLRELSARRTSLGPSTMSSTSNSSLSSAGRALPRTPDPGPSAQRQSLDPSLALAPGEGRQRPNYSNLGALEILRRH